MAKRKKKDAACELVAYRFYGIPSEQDAVQEDKTFGCCRYLWNRMLGDHNTLYAEIGYVPNNTPADYKDLDECLFLNEVDSLALANTTLNLDAAFERFFKKTGGYPRFKAKKRAKRSYTTNAIYGSHKGRPTCNIQLNTSNGLLKLPKHRDPVRLKLHRPIKPGVEIRDHHPGAGREAVLLHPDGIPETAGSHTACYSKRHRTGLLYAEPVRGQ